MACHDFKDYLQENMECSDYFPDEMQQHFIHCDECRNEYESWLETDQYIQAAIFQQENKISFVEKVMDRLRHEEKWSAPVTQQLTLSTNRFRKPILYISLLGLLLFAVFYINMIIGISLKDQSFILEAGVQKAAIAQPITSEVNLENTTVVASISEPIAIAVEEHNTNGTMLGITLFGCISSILSLGWVLRTFR